MKFTMTDPCPKCPFRSDIRPFLHPERAKEIADGLTRQQQTFQCHQTVEWSEDEDPVVLDTPNAQHCAGALIILEQTNRPNQMMRWMERVGGYDRRKLNMAAPVFKTMRAFIDAQRKGRK